jgi:hypothetical protein
MMRNSFIMLFIIVTAALGIATPSSAGMSSSSYQVPASVLSGGGIPMSSSSFRTDTTLGQAFSSNLALSSESFKTNTGFWNTIYYVSILAGDINNDGTIDLTDAILALKILSNISLPVTLFKAADVNGDGVIGLQEALQALQVTSGLKSQP